MHPKLKKDADVKATRLEIDLKLAVKSTAPWVKSPAHLMLHHNGRTFEVEVDPTALPEGVHYAEVQGYDSSAEWRGPLFRVPITVVRPLQLTARPGRLALEATGDAAGAVLQGEAVLCLGTEPFVPGKEMRRFVAVPEGATWAEMKIKAVAGETPKSLMLRATALVPHTRYSDSEHRSFVQLAPYAEHTTSFTVTPGTTLEVTVAQFWSSLGEATLETELHFHGVHAAPANGSALLIDGGAGGPLKVYARAPLRREKIKPTAKLDAVRIPLRPTDAELSPLSAPRDVLPGGRTIHRLVLTYKFSLTEGGKVTPRVPLLNKFVYDGEIEAQMVFVCDANKQVLAVGDIYPETTTLKKGDYTIRVHLRHEDPTLLDKLKALPLVVDRALDSAVSVPVYATHGDAVKGTNAVTKERVLCPGERIALFLGPVQEDKLPRDATPGRQLTGTLLLGQSNAGKDAPGALPLVYTVAPKKAEPAGGNGAGKSGEAEQTPEEALAEAVRDAEVKFLSEMKTDSEEKKAAYAKLLADLKARFPAHLPILREPLKRLVASPDKDSDAETQQGIVDAADAVLTAIDLTELAVFLAQKCPEEGTGAEKRKKEMEEKKAAVVEALGAKCAALLELEKGGAEGDAPQPSAFDAAFAELRKWADPAADAQRAVLLAKREMRSGRLAGALKALDKVAAPEDKPAAREVLEQRESLLRQLGWEHWAKAERTRIKRAFPPGYPPL